MDNTKICTKCGALKPLAEFHKSKLHKDGRKPRCKDCRSIDAAIATASPEAKAKISKSAKRYYQANMERVKEVSMKYKLKKKMEKKLIIKPEPTTCRVYFKTCPKTNELFTAKRAATTFSREGYKINVREKQMTEDYKITKRKRRRISDAILRKENPMIRIRLNISRAINQSLRKGKGTAWQNAVGYTLDQLKQRLENLFHPGMTWENYGKYGWHIDHIRPVASFLFESVECAAFKQCWAIENLQPLWWDENLKKGANYVPGQAA